VVIYIYIYISSAVFLSRKFDVKRCDKGIFYFFQYIKLKLIFGRGQFCLGLSVSRM